MKWVLAVVLLAATGFGGWYLYVSRTSEVRTTAADAGERGLLLPKGTVVRLVLLQPIRSGEAKVGDKVVFVVREPVRATNGDEVIPVGTCALATVTQSRAAGTLSQLLRQPARLAVRFDSLTTDAGVRIPLSASGENGEHAFTRDNTGPPVSEATLDAVLRHPTTQRALTELAQRVQRGDYRGLDEDAQLSEAVAGAARRLGLSQIAQSAEDAKLAEVGRMLDRLQTSPEAGLVASSAPWIALIELAALASGTDDWLQGRFKGPNIRAHPGTVVEVTVPADTRLLAPLAQNRGKR